MLFQMGQLRGHGDRALGQALEAEAARFNGRVGCALASLQTGEKIERDADSIFPTASTVALAIITAFYELVNSGKRDWENQVSADRSLSIGGPGVLQYLGLPTHSDRNVAWLMICQSHNFAINLLLNSYTIKRTSSLDSVLVGDHNAVEKFAAFRPGALLRYKVAHQPCDSVHLPSCNGRGFTTRFSCHHKSRRAAARSQKHKQIFTSLSVSSWVTARISLEIMNADAENTNYAVENTAPLSIVRMAKASHGARIVESA